MPAPNVLRPNLVLIIDCKCEKRRPSPPTLDNALQGLIASRATCGLILPLGDSWDHSLLPGRSNLLPTAAT